MSVGVFTLCYVKSDKIAEFEAIAKQFVAESQTHSGCLHYDCGKVAESENQYAFVEKWASPADFTAHIEHPFFKANAPEMAAYTTDGSLHTQTVDLF